MSSATNDGIAVAVIERIEANLITAGGKLWPLKNQNKDHITDSPYIEYIPSPDRPVAYVKSGDLNGFILINIWVPRNYGSVESLRQAEEICRIFPRGKSIEGLNIQTGELFNIDIGIGDIESQRNGSGDRDKWSYTSCIVRYESLQSH